MSNPFAGNNNPFAPPAGPSDPGSGGVSAEQLNAALGAHNSSGASHPGLQAALAEAVTTERNARQAADTDLEGRAASLEQRVNPLEWTPWGVAITATRTARSAIVQAMDLYRPGGIPRADLAQDVQEALGKAESAMRKGTPGTYTQGVDFDNGTITFEDWFNANVKYRTFDGDLTFVFRQPTPQAVAIEKFTMLSTSNINNILTIDVDMPEGLPHVTRSFNLRGIRGLVKLTGKNWRGFAGSASARFVDRVDFIGTQIDTNEYEELVFPFSSISFWDANVNFNSYAKAHFPGNLNFYSGTMTTLQTGAQVKVDGNLARHGLLAIFPTADLDVAGTTTNAPGFTGDDRPGHPLEAFKRKGEAADSYSTDEHLTGAYWVDGRPIYRLVIDQEIDIQSPGYQPHYIGLDVPFMDHLISAQGTLDISEAPGGPGPNDVRLVIPGCARWGNPSGSADMTVSVYAHRDGITLAIQNSLMSGNRHMTLFIEYVKYT
ncbi:MAG: hypothetical protein FWG97_01175 [Deltaproteobacteria bacterium]|nr:hypothetical protein [Deltaproteobacteria bacterium]